MAVYAVRCPHCESRLKFRDHRALGRAVRCPKCGAKFRMPRSSDEQKRPGQTVPVAESVPDREREAEPPARKWLIAAMAGLAVVGLASASYLFWSRSSERPSTPQEVALTIENAPQRQPIEHPAEDAAAVAASPEPRVPPQDKQPPDHPVSMATAPREVELETPSLPSFVAPADSPLFEDRFDQPELGSLWQVVNGRFTIREGRLVLSDPSGGEIQCTEAVSPPCVVQVTLWQKHDPRAIAWAEPRAGIRLRSAAKSDKALTIRVSSGGTIEKAADPGEKDRRILGACRSQPTRLILEVTRSRVVVYANGGYVAEVRPAEGAPLKVSLFASAGNASFDDFLITQGTYRPPWNWNLNPLADFLTPETRITLEEWAKAASESRHRNVVRSRLCRVTSDPSEGFARTVWHIQQQIETAESPSQRKTLAKKLERQVGDFGLVTWYFNPWLLLPKGALPPGLVNLKRLKIVCVQDEIEPAAFYVTNLRTKPCRIEIAVDSPGGVTAAYFVDASQNVSQDLISIMRPISPGAELDALAALAPPPLVIPPMESRQVWISVDTSQLQPGRHQFPVRVIPLDSAWPTKTVLVELQVLPIRIPEMPPFDTFTYNFARDRAELYEDLRRHKVNWVSMSEPQWRLDGGKLILDFTYLDQEITLSKGKGPHLAIYGFIKNMADRLQNEYEIPWDDPRAKEYIIEYARRWAAHLEELGMSPDQYAWQIYDEPRNKTDFARLREIVPLLKEAVPQVRFALDPLTKDPELYRDMGPYIDLWIPHHGMVYTADPERDPTTVGQRMPDASTAATMDVLLKNRKEGSRMWCYMQYAHQEQAYRECPAAVFRHYVWRIIWGLKADGVAFHAHWYASGQLKRPCKGWEAFREGIEDVQWALLLQEAVEEGRVDKELGHRALRAVDRLGCGLDWWLEQPVQRSDDMDWARLIAVQTLLGQSLSLPEDLKRRVFGSPVE